MKFRDLTGQTFNRWTVIERADKGPRAWWHCRCECGNVGVIRGSHLTSQLSKGCRDCGYRDITTPIDKHKVAGMRARGMPVWKIAQKLGCHQQTLRHHMGWSMEDPQRRSHWMHKHADTIREARRMGQMWSQIFCALDAPYRCFRSLQTAYSSYRGTSLRRQLRAKERQMERARQVDAVRQMTKEGLSAKDIAERLGVAERTVVRLRSKTVNVDVPKIDLERANKLLMRGLGYGEVNQRLGRPLETPHEFEAVYNFWMDVAA